MARVDAFAEQNMPGTNSLLFPQKSGLLTTVLEKIFAATMVCMRTFMWEKFRETNSAPDEGRRAIYWGNERVGGTKRVHERK